MIVFSHFSQVLTNNIQLKRSIFRFYFNIGIETCEQPLFHTKFNGHVNIIISEKLPFFFVFQLVLIYNLI